MSFPSHGRGFDFSLLSRLISIGAALGKFRLGLQCWGHHARTMSHFLSGASLCRPAEMTRLVLAKTSDSLYIAEVNRATIDPVNMKAVSTPAFVVVALT